MLNLIPDFVLAWSLLTSIPLPSVPVDSGRSLGHATGYFPVVGLIIGLVLAGAGWLLYAVLPVGVAAALLLALWAGLTGLLHLDGFMDSCDGLLPPRDPERRLEIMKDSQAGAFGVVGVILLLLVKFNGLAALPASYPSGTLITVPVLARWAMTWTMARYPLARREGMAILFRAGLGWRQVGLASVVSLLVAIAWLGWLGVVLLAITWLTATLLARLAMARLGGLTGDIYGAICEMVELVLLVVAGALAGWL